jgi:hypothetical protein
LRGRNEVTDELVKLGYSQAKAPQGFSCKNFMSQASAGPPVEKKIEVPGVMKINSDWRTPYMIYLWTGGLPDDEDECERLRRRVGHYTLVHDELLWRSANDTLMRCVPPEEGCSILQDIHSGICVSQAGTQNRGTGQISDGCKKTYRNSTMCYEQLFIFANM